MIVPMCSIFNLIRSCEQQLNQGSLVEVDALFGCSVILFKIDDEQELTTEELEYACDMLFYTINWYATRTKQKLCFFFSFLLK